MNDLGVACLLLPLQSGTGLGQDVLPLMARALPNFRKQTAPRGATASRESGNAGLRDTRAGSRKSGIDGMVVLSRGRRSGILLIKSRRALSRFLRRSGAGLAHQALANAGRNDGRSLPGKTAFAASVGGGCASSLRQAGVYAGCGWTDHVRGGSAAALEGAGAMVSRGR